MNVGTRVVDIIILIYLFSLGFFYGIDPLLGLTRLEESLRTIKGRFQSIRIQDAQLLKQNDSRSGLFVFFECELTIIEIENG